MNFIKLTLQIYLNLKSKLRALLKKMKSQIFNNHKSYFVNRKFTNHNSQITNHKSSTIALRKS